MAEAFRESRWRVLDRTSRLLETALDPKATLVTIAKLAVPELADIATVSLLGPKGQRQPFSAAATEPRNVALLEELGRQGALDQPDSLARRAMEEQRALVVEDMQKLLASWRGAPEIRELLTSLGMRAALGVPMIARGRVLGAMVFGYTGERAITPALVELCEEVSHRCAIALDNARLHQELQRSEARYRSLVSASTQMVWTTDPQGMIEDLPEWRAFTGQTVDEVRGVGWLDAIHPGDRERVAQTWWEAYRTRSTYLAEYRVRGKDGQYRRFVARAVPVLSPEGEIEQWLGTWNDVTETHDQRALLEAVLRQMPGGLVVRGADGRLVMANERARLLLGILDPEGVVPRTNVKRLDGTRPGVHDLPGSRAARGEMVRGEVLVVEGADGQTRLVSIQASPVRDEEGMLRWTVLQAEDVTEQMRAAEALRESREQLDLVVRHATVGIALADREGRNVIVNDRMRDILGTRMPDNLGQQRPYVGRYVRTGAEIAQGDWPLQRALRGESVHEEMEITRGDGTTILIQCNTIPLRDASGAVMSALAVLEDITPLREAQRELDVARREMAQSEKLSALGSLVAGVAHEVRTPLAYITNNLHIVEQRVARADPRLAGELEAPVRAALEGVDRISYLVKELRRFTKHESAPRQPCSLREVVEEAAQLFRSTHPAAPVRLSLAETGNVLADRAQLQQIVLNLLENAADAAGPRGGLAMETRRAQTGVELRVSDKGPGIPAEVQPRMFDPFFTTKPEGTGLGLAIVRRIVEQHGGTITWETGSGGTTFVVSLPSA